MTVIATNTIIRSAGTQFRTVMIEDNVVDLMDLIERGVPFNTPMRLARFNDTLYLVDGFHRMEAFGRLGFTEIPADCFSITEAASIEEVRTLAAGANVQHGKGNVRGDYYSIIKKLMEFGDTYMKNVFEPDIKKIAEAIGAARPAVGRGYNDYFGTKEAPHASLSAQCEERLHAAVREQKKEGTSNKAIARMFKLSGPTAVARILGAEEGSQNPESGKRDPQSPAVLPMANTQDRSDTRVDADEMKPAAQSPE